MRDARAHLLAAVIGELLKQPRIEDEYTLTGVDQLHGMLERRIVSALNKGSAEKSFGEVVYDSGRDAPVQRTLTAFAETPGLLPAHKEWLVGLVQIVIREKSSRVYRALKGAVVERVDARDPQDAAQRVQSTTQRSRDTALSRAMD